MEVDDVPTVILPEAIIAKHCQKKNVIGTFTADQIKPIRSGTPLPCFLEVSSSDEEQFTTKKRRMQRSVAQTALQLQRAKLTSDTLLPVKATHVTTKHSFSHQLHDETGNDSESTNSMFNEKSLDVRGVVQHKV